MIALHPTDQRGVGGATEEGACPLYANAPPKPKRLNTSREDYSSSPERSPERYSGSTPSIVMLEHHNNRRQQTNDAATPSAPLRRTPDAYGRFRCDYDDVYGARDYATARNSTCARSEVARRVPARPHSVDVLEMSRDYWSSEERYAQQVRHSSALRVAREDEISRDVKESALWSYVQHGRNGEAFQEAGGRHRQVNGLDRSGEVLNESIGRYRGPISAPVGRSLQVSGSQETLLDGQQTEEEEEAEPQLFNRSLSARLPRPPVAKSPDVLNMSAASDVHHLDITDNTRFEQVIQSVFGRFREVFG